MDHKMFIIVVVAIYFVVLLGIGFFTRNKNNEVDDFLVAGRNVGLVVGGFSIASVQPMDLSLVYGRECIMR